MFYLIIRIRCLTTIVIFCIFTSMSSYIYKRERITKRHRCFQRNARPIPRSSRDSVHISSFCKCLHQPDSCFHIPYSFTYKVRCSSRWSFGLLIRMLGRYISRFQVRFGSFYTRGSQGSDHILTGHLSSWVNTGSGH